MITCPFCRPDPDRVFYQGELVLGLWDAFPVNPGHALIVSRRHVASWFDATAEEQSEILAAIPLARAAIQASSQPGGFNIGINVGEAAGVLAQDRRGFSALSDGFEALFRDPRSIPLAAAWVEDYRRRRAPPRTNHELPPEPLLPPPTPHDIQLEALAALARTRDEQQSAGLVVMATGLGKTWLAAFDFERSGARRALFVAHRDEILRQALDTFRRMRPLARLGYYTGKDKTPDVDVLFASIQTLGRPGHLARFAPDQFEYIVVDEFHHVAARTYRNLIAHFEPRFLLGLTATPERTDGGELLSLCGENLVYRCDLFDAIRRAPDRLVPFHYFGVPDEID